MNITIHGKEKQFKYITKILLFFAFVLFMVVNYMNNYYFNKTSMIITLISSLVLLYKSRNDVGHFIAFTFITYAIYKISYEYLFDVKTTFYNVFYIDYNYNLVIAILCYFTTYIAIFYRERQTKKHYCITTKNNVLIYYILYFVCLFVLIFGIKRVHADGYIVSIKTIYEYFLIFFMFAYYYSGKSKTKKKFLLLLGIIYVFQDFYYGGRISSIQFLILICLLYYSKKLNSKKIMLLSLPAIILMNVVEFYRNNYTLEQVALSFINIFNPNTNYKWNTFSEVLYSSSGLTYAKLEVFTLHGRLDSFSQFFTNIFIGGKNELGDIIPYISTNISRVGGGGYIPVYFYFWFGWFGVVLISMLICYLFNENLKLKWIKKDFYILFNMVFISMTPRWYAYTPLILFRFVILNFIIIYYLLYLLDILTQKKAARV